MSSQSPTLVDHIWTYGKILAQFPSFFGAVNESETSDGPLVDRMISRGMMGVLAVAASMAAPFVFAGGAVVKAGEKIWTKIDVFPEVAARVQVFGQALNHQQELIEQFRPLLDMRNRAALLAKQTERQAEEAEAGAKTLQQLREEYGPAAPLLEQVESVVAELELAALSDPSGLKNTLFQQRVEMLKNLAEEEQKVRDLTIRLKGIVARVQEKLGQLEQLERDATFLTQIKGRQIKNLQSVVPPAASPPSTPGISHVAVDSVV